MTEEQALEIVNAAVENVEGGDLGDRIQEAVYYGDKLEYKNYLLENQEQVGGEGEGDHYHIVFSITNKDTSEKVFMKIDGYYSSWEGTDFYGNEPYLVEPKNKTIVVYEKVK